VSLAMLHPTFIVSSKRASIGDGVIICEAQVIIFIRTDGNEEFAMVADDVTRMRVDGLLHV
jgi:hypothetical protein